MGKKNRWFGWVKRLFVSDEKPKAEKKFQKSKKCRWVLGRFKFRQCPALPEPERSVHEAAEKHRKYAMTVALATAAAAEAAVAAAQAAAEVVRLTSLSQSYHHLTNGDVSSAAIKIQSAFRAYLARKALRALKALVKLQAVARGRAVRRKTAFKLMHLPSREQRLSGEQEKNIFTVDSICKYVKKKRVSEVEESKGKSYRRDNQLIFKHAASKFHQPVQKLFCGQPLECDSQTSWDHSGLSKQDAEAIWFKKQAASLRREQMLKYSFSQQERRNNQLLTNSLHRKGSGRHSYLVEEWAKKETCDKGGFENLKPIALGAVQTNVRTLAKQDHFDGLNSPPVLFPRRSFGRSKWSTAVTESSAPNSPVFPTYMAATQSAMAKARSMSTPKQRVAIQDNFYDRSFSHKNESLVWSSYNGELLLTKGKSGANLQHTSTVTNLY